MTISLSCFHHIRYEHAAPILTSGIIIEVVFERQMCYHCISYLHRNRIRHEYENSTLCFGSLFVSLSFVSDVAGLHNSSAEISIPFYLTIENLFVQVIVVISVFDSINSFLKIQRIFAGKHVGKC